MAWGEHIVAAGSDAKVSFYDLEGNLASRFDYSSEEGLGDFTKAVVNPSGDSFIVGNFNRFYVYSYNKRRG